MKSSAFVNVFNGPLHFNMPGVQALVFSCSLLASSAGYSQVLPGYAPTAFQPQLEAGTSNFTIETGVQCPTTTLNLTGFGGNLNAWGDTHYSPHQSLSAGVGNYGIAAGVSIPLGRALIDFCKKYANGRLEFQKTLLQNQLMNSQFALFRHCKYFRDLGYDLTEREFADKEGPLSIFDSCNKLSQLLHPKAQKTPRSPMPVPTPPPFSTKSDSPNVPSVFITNPPAR
jgi:hypothetical protein